MNTTEVQLIRHHLNANAQGKDSPEKCNTTWIKNCLQMKRYYKVLKHLLICILCVINTNLFIDKQQFFISISISTEQDLW